MQQLIFIIHILVAVSLIGLVLMQQGKGADMGASFGGGGSQTLFGSTGSGSFLVKVTSALAAIFFITSLLLGYAARQNPMVDPTSQVLAPTTTTTAAKAELPAAPAKVEKHS